MYVLLQMMRQEQLHTHFGDYFLRCTFEKADVDNHSPINLNNQNYIRQAISWAKTGIVVKINNWNISQYLNPFSFTLSIWRFDLQSRVQTLLENHSRFHAVVCSLWHCNEICRKLPISMKGINLIPKKHK